MFTGQKKRSSFGTFEAALTDLGREFSKIDSDQANSLALTATLPLSRWRRITPRTKRSLPPKARRHFARAAFGALTRAEHPLAPVR